MVESRNYFFFDFLCERLAVAKVPRFGVETVFTVIAATAYVKEELKDLNLLFRGSSNQRIILVKPSLKSDEVVLWDEKTIV